jgi:hypothetical protein
MVDSINLNWVKADAGHPDMVAYARSAALPFVETTLDNNGVSLPSSVFEVAAKRGHFVEAVCDGLRLIAENPLQDTHEGRANEAMLALVHLEEIHRKSMSPKAT